MEIKTFYISKKIVKVKISDITLKRKNNPLNLCDDEIFSLASSIKKNGLIEPIYLRRDINNPKKYILVDGLRRFKAFEFLGAKSIPSIILSLTDAEADMVFLYENENKKHISVFEKAFYMGEVLKSGRINKNELADALGISLKNLEKKLNILTLDNEEKKIMINHNFDEEFIFSVLKFEKEKRREILNEIIVKNLTNNEAKKYLDELKKPEIKRVKTATLTSDKIILNSLERMAMHLNDSGIEAESLKNELEDATEYILKINKKSQ